jgi:DNA-binding GntR family transcriptional regulator
MKTTPSAGSKNGHAAPGFILGDAPHVSLTKADAAYGEIKARILACDLEPGSVIDQEMFASWLGSSTTPVREALRRLEAERLVVLRAHSDVRVAPASVAEFREFHEIRMGLETYAAEMAAAKASDELIASLRRFVEQKPSKRAGREVDLASSRLFHRTIYAAAGNHTLTDFLDSVWDRVGRYRVMLAGAGSVSSCDSPEHQALCEAFARRDPAAVGRLMREDLETSFKRLEPILESTLGVPA